MDPQKVPVQGPPAPRAEPPAVPDVINVVHTTLQNAPTFSVTITKNTKGYNWEIGIHGARSVEELQLKMREARAELAEQLEQLGAGTVTPIGGPNDDLLRQGEAPKASPKKRDEWTEEIDG